MTSKRIKKNYDIIYYWIVFKVFMIKMYEILTLSEVVML